MSTEYTMSSEDKEDSTMVRSITEKQLKHEDLLQYSNIFASEFNNSSLHDKVLVFEVTEEKHLIAGMRSEWDRSTNAEQETSESEKNLFQDEANEIEEGNEQELETVAASSLDCKMNVENKIQREQLQYDDTNGNHTIEHEKEKKRKGISKQVKHEEHLNTVSDLASMKEHKIFVHSSWLSVQSSYFRALFYSGMKETHSKEVFMRVTEEELTPHLTLIEAMYQPDILDNKDWNLVLKVLTLANKYDVTLVFKKCKYVLMSMPMSLDVCECILTTVDEMLATNDLLTLLEKFLVNEFRPLDRTWRMDKFIDLSEAALRLLISSNDLAVLSENTVFVALTHWVEYNEYAGASLLPLVRPELMTVDFLHDVVQQSYQATKMNGFNQLLLKGFSYHSFSAQRKLMLETKPIKRIAYDDDQPAFSWAIAIKKNKHLPKFTETYQSEHFWCHGYEMMLSLSFESNKCNIYLYVLNSNGKVYVNMSWRVKADSFFGGPLEFRQIFRDSYGWGCDKIQCRLVQPIQDDCTYNINVWVDLLT